MLLLLMVAVEIGELKNVEEKKCGWGHTKRSSNAQIYVSNFTLLYDQDWIIAFEKKLNVNESEAARIFHN